MGQQDRLPLRHPCSSDGGLIRQTLSITAAGFIRTRATVEAGRWTPGRSSRGRRFGDWPFPRIGPPYVAANMWLPTRRPRTEARSARRTAPHRPAEAQGQKESN
jgi:hypothetical protein